MASDDVAGVDGSILDLSGMLGGRSRSMLHMRILDLELGGNPLLRFTGGIRIQECESH